MLNSCSEEAYVHKSRIKYLNCAFEDKKKIDFFFFCFDRKVDNFSFLRKEKHFCVYPRPNMTETLSNDSRNL